MTLQLQSAISPIPGYELQERIGTGGYGEVWRSTAPGGLLKAVKFVFGYMDDERATRELKALQRIREVRHPFLLSLERIEVVEGQLVIVTELADGSLKDRFVQCRQEGLPGIPRDELLEHLRDAAAALDFMSERHSLQHLDVKPENLLLVGGRVKVADFGLVKDLIDGSISLMGSMTPIYAPPEVFDGRPSRASDQYSLAIVYQEMLTGVLPFPGKTLAQLAAQHLSSRPRLAALPTADHAAVALALAKDPAARHANCRALIEALFSAGQSSPQGAAIESVSAAERTSAKSDTKTNGKSPTHAAPQTPAKRSARPGSGAPVYKTVVLGSAPAESEQAANWPTEGSAASSDGGGLGLAEAPADDDDLPTTVTWLPPLPAEQPDVALRPTLFIGLGGLAGRALQQLRGRLAEQFGDLDEMPAVQLLLIDTDVRALTQASSGPAERSLTTSQTMALPLRKTLDYRSDSRKLLRWLSRRWLYNIPRSLQTEGLRPLGRLALVDHADQVHKRLRAALTAVVAPDAVAASAIYADRPFEGPPRVFVVSSISGGAGSGMVLDVAYAVRHAAAELGLNVDDLCGLLAHVTSRDVDAQALAVANAHSFLQELHHYSHPAGGYPGDPACGLPASPPGVAPFAHAYVMHLGDDLVDGQFDAAADTLAEYLYRASVTPAAAMLDACRRPRAAANDADVRPSVTGVRSIGLCPLGVSPGNLGQTTEALCRQVVEGWRGADATTIDARAAQQADERGLGLEATARTIQALIAQGLGGDAGAYIHRTVVGYQARAATRDAHDSNGAGPLAGMNKALGLLDVDEAPRQSLGAVETGLPKLLQELTITRLDGLRTWLLERVNDPDAGLTAAGRAADWFVQHFRAIEKRAAEQRGKLTEELKDLERGLLAAAPPERSRRRAWLGLGPAVRPGSEQEQWMTRYAQARLEGIVWQGVSGHARGCAAQAGAIAAQLKDLGRDVALVAAQFHPPEDALNAPARPKGECTAPVDGEDENARASLAAMLHKEMAGLVARMDADLRREFLSVEGCMLDVLCRRVDLRGTLPPRLRAAARGVVLDALQQIDVADVLFPAMRGDATADDAASEPLRAALRRATPEWLETGGARRLLMFLPEGTSVDRLQGLLEREAGARASVSRDAGGDLLLGCEVEGLSIPRIAASLVADRPDCREAAARLHARIDVVWRKARAWR